MEAKMDFSSVNWLAVVACVVISMVTGTVMVQPQDLFPHVVGGGWSRASATRHGKYGHDLRSDGSGFSRAGGCHDVHAQRIGAYPLQAQVRGLTGLCSGLVLSRRPIWSINFLPGHGLKIWAIEIGNHLVNFLIFGALLAVWK
jgi:hypothetical protein